MADVFDRYLTELRRTPLQEKTEHMDRGALEALLKEFAGSAGAGIAVQHEPKRVAGKGAPDFKVTNSGAILGYVENKGIGENLDQVLKSEQIKKYRSLSANILLTDYLHWIWIRGDAIQRESLCFPTDLESPKFRVRPEKAEAVAALINGFFSTAPEGIARAQTLAIELAKRSQLLRDFLTEELVRQQREHTEGRLYGLYLVFRDQVFHELSLKEFADAFAQMLAYGLFLARLNADGVEVTLRNAQEYVPGSFRLIRELVDFLGVLDNEEYRDVRWVVEEVLSLVNGLDVAAIHEDLSFRRRRAISRRVRAKDEEEWRLFSRDPYVYFYEDYLARYDAQMRKSRGVYYTPPPVVNFIVRAIDDVLKDTFGIKDGLADHNRVTVLDFACGTGTFLVEVFQRIFENIGGSESGKAGLIVRDHILRNIYGFEYLIAPYTIAHLKLSQFLADRGHALSENQRLQVFLTNTLEPVEPQENFLLPALTQETEAAQDVKDKPILVITGNPPYSGFSKNMGNAAKALIERYKYVDGKHFGERKHWLHDDYVKFIAFAQQKMDAVDQGVVGIITNHAWLDNPTFRGMRQSLLDTFDQIYVVDLHGNANRREVAPDGSADNNVFDIRQGVAVSLFIKNKRSTKGVWHSDLWGRRLDKYQALAATAYGEMTWHKANPQPPYYMFLPYVSSIPKDFLEARDFRDIFENIATGMLSARDSLTICFSENEILDRVRDFAGLTVGQAKEKYKLRDDTRDWKIESAQKDVRTALKAGVQPTRIIYRPFDVRFTIYTGQSKGFIGQPPNQTWDDLKLDNNFVLCLTKRVETSDYRHVAIAECIPDGHLVSSKDTTHTASLFTADPLTGDKRENFLPSFRRWLNARYKHSFSPEEVMSYIYAVLCAPVYREAHAEFLRIDFPRIPFPESRADFEKLSKLGWDLIQKHLLREVPELGLGRYQGKGDHMVERQRYVLVEEAVYINKAQFFAPVPPEVWDFHIGGYRVIDTYLRYRKGRTLSLDEVANVEKVFNVLAYTITAMQRIDEAYARAFAAEVA